MPQPYDAWTSADWREPFEAYLETEAEPDNLTDVEVRAALKLRSGGPVVELTVANGGVVMGPAAHAFTLVVPTASPPRLPAGLYDLEIVFERAGGVVEPFHRAALNVVQGVRE